MESPLSYLLSLVLEVLKAQGKEQVQSILRGEQGAQLGLGVQLCAPEHLPSSLSLA